MGENYKYSNEELAERASQYTILKVFTKKEPQIYQAMQRRGLIEELCKHMKRDMRTLTDKELGEIALQYHTKKEFRKNDESAYVVAHRRGILNAICKHMKSRYVHRGFYTLEYCRTIARRYKTRTELETKCKRVYRAAQRRGWLDDICSHMVPAGTGRKRKVYVFTFEDGYAYVGLTDDISRRKREHLNVLRPKKMSPVLRHHQKTGAKYEFKLLTDWLDLDVAGQVEDDYIKQYKADGWKMLNRRRGGDLGGRTGMFAPVRIRQTVGRYEYAEDFKDKEIEVYEYLCNNHLYSKYCTGLKHRQKRPNYWTLEKSIEVIPECETRTVFQKRYYQAYRAVKDAGLLDEYYPAEVRTSYKWTIDKSIEVAKSCRSRMELHRKYSGAYNVLREAGLLDDVLPSKKYWEKYDDEEKMKIIARCKTKRELHDNFRQVYEWLRLSNRLDEFFPKRISGSL